MVGIDREFLLIARKARRRALWNALTCGPEARLSYAMGRTVHCAVLAEEIYGIAIDQDRAIHRFASIFRRLAHVKGRLNV